MPLTTAKGGITTQSGNISQVLIAEQSNYATPIAISPAANTPEATSANGFYRYQPRINSMDIAREGTTLPAVFFDGSAAQTRDAPGPIDIANGLSFGLSGNGTALFLRMLTQDPNPAWNILGGTGTTIPNAVTVVNAASLSTTTATVADNLSSTSNPVRLSVALTSGALSGTRGVITLNGTDAEDTPITESIAYASGNLGTAATSNLWYKTVTGVSFSGFSGGTATITARDRAARVIFTPHDDELRVFWTAEVTKGITPNVYDGLCMQNATISLTRDALVAFECTFLGRNARLYTNLSGATRADDQTAGATNRATKSTRGSGLEEASPDVFAGWQTRLTAENTDLQIALQDGTFTLNQELAYTNTLGDRFQGTQPARDTKRLVQTEGTVVYAPENNYSTYFESNQPIPNVNLSWSQGGYGAFPYKLTIEKPEAQLTADPDPSVADPGAISQTVTMKATKSERFPNYEYRIIAEYSEYAPLDDLS